VIDEDKLNALELFGENEYLHNEVERLKEENDRLEDFNEELMEERNRLNNIIGEAIEYIQDRYDGEVLTHTFDKCNVGELLEILDKGE